MPWVRTIHGIPYQANDIYPFSEMMKKSWAWGSPEPYKGYLKEMNAAIHFLHKWFRRKPWLWRIGYRRTWIDEVKSYIWKIFRYEKNSLIKLMIISFPGTVEQIKEKYGGLRCYVICYNKVQKLDYCKAYYRISKKWPRLIPYLDPDFTPATVFNDWVKYEKEVM